LKRLGVGGHLILTIVNSGGFRFEPTHEQLIETYHQRGEIVVPTIVDEKPVPLPTPDDWRPRCAFSEIEQPPELLFDGLGAHRQSTLELAQIESIHAVRTT
jgi:hypothetical protein